ncbi:MAG TPA: TIGR00341 family protein [Ramlibacter sp.]|nr:TIGR00341 family protein [Ramlibacter sp.]
MSDSQINEHPSLGERARSALSHRFSLRTDQAPQEQIDIRLRAGVELTGATPWILMFAIFIASIGLNVNSAAVIIGAMLISPLMGPIMGIGYGIAIYDFPLIRRSLLNLGIAAGISLLTSTLYFLLTPLGQPQTELLARTTPTIWDVLIALFGGLAGIVAATRKEKSNVIPGVAIATALMPPLCTAGYGLAHQNWEFLFGAFYLFSINCVFIAVSVVLVTGFLHMPQRNFVDARVERRVKATLLVLVTAMSVPSAYLAYRMVGDEVFRTSAQGFVEREFNFQHTSVVALSIEPKKRLIEATLSGEPIAEATIKKLQAMLPAAGLGGANMVVRQGVDHRIDVKSIREGILADLYRNSIQALGERDARIQKLQAELSMQSIGKAETASVLLELQAQLPGLTHAFVGRGSELAGTSDAPVPDSPLLALSVPKALSAKEHERLVRWFRVRVKDPDAQVFIAVTPRTRK